MKIIDRYFLTQYSKTFFYSILFFTFIMLVSQFFEKIDIFLTFKTPFNKILIYLLYRLPFWLGQITPVATLLATLFCLSNFTRYNEITAMKASGLSLWRLLLPMFIFAILVGLASFIFNETLVPQLSWKAKIYERIVIRHQNPEDYLQREHVILYGAKRRIYNVGLFDGESNILHQIRIDEFTSHNRLWRQIIAQKAQWLNGQWHFYQGMVREFNTENKNITTETPFVETVLPLEETPQDFKQEIRKSTEMGYQELRKYIEKLNRNGINSYQELVELHLKIAFAFANMIILLLGIPFALSSKHASKVVNFGTAMLISFIYWGTMEIGHSLGENNVLPPLIAAWLANIIFGGIGIIFLIKVRK